MIGYLKGILLAKTPDSLIIDVSGVGYEVSVPTSSFCILPKEGELASMFIYTYVREDAIRLFGFSSIFDRTVFQLLLSVSSVGPKMALTIMGPMHGKEVCACIIDGDLASLTSIPGVGAKTAERLILELKTKCQKLLAVETDNINDISTSSVKIQKRERRLVLDDALSALLNLGYKEKSIQEALKVYDKKNEDELILENVLRDVLKTMSSR